MAASVLASTYALATFSGLAACGGRTGLRDGAGPPAPVDAARDSERPDAAPGGSPDSSVIDATTDAHALIDSPIDSPAPLGEPVPADSKELRGVRPWILDRDLAARLWDKSGAWTDVRFAD